MSVATASRAWGVRLRLFNRFGACLARSCHVLICVAWSHDSNRHIGTIHGSEKEKPPILIYNSLRSRKWDGASDDNEKRASISFAGRRNNSAIYRYPRCSDDTMICDSLIESKWLCICSVVHLSFRLNSSTNEARKLRQTLWFMGTHW